MARTDLYLQLDGGTAQFADSEINAHAKSGLILRPGRYAQIVPDIRAIAIFGAFEDDLQRSESYSQYISTARVGIRSTPQLKD